MSAPYDPALVERMVALVRQICADTPPHLDGSRAREARAINSELPEPVDPDLIEAREIYAQHFGDLTAKCIKQGDYDALLAMQCALAGIKRGRELAEQGK